MRSATGPELTTLGLLTRTITWRVKIANGSGTMIDMSSWVESVSRNEDVDQPVAGATVSFTRASGVLQNLSPLRTDSTLNRLDDGVTYGPLIDLVRAITIEKATTPLGVSTVAGDYKLKFKGTTATVDFSGNPVVVDCRDEGGLLVDRWVETPRPYGSGPGVAVETVIQSIHDDALGAGVVNLYTPTSPAYLISPVYQQQIQSIMDADVALAQLPGADVRYKWDNGTGAFRYTLSLPDRTKTVPDYTFGPKDYYDVTTLALSETDIRNVVMVEFYDSADFGNKKTITVSDSASITKYRRRPLFIPELRTSPINTVSEATTMANAALADLKDPKAEFEVVVPFFWPAELGDLYRFTSNGVHFDTNQDWAVVSITDELSRGKHETRLRLRGKPAGQYLSWLGRGGTIGGGPAQPPTPVITWKNTEVDESVWRFRFSVLNGSGGGGTNISYLITTKRASAAESTISSGTAASLPIDIDITRDPQVEKVVRFSVTDSATGLTAEDRISVPSVRGEVDSSGHPKRGVAFDDTSYALRATESNGSTRKSDALKAQGSMIPAPTAANPFPYASGGPSSGEMWIVWSWSGFSILQPDGTSISVPASSSLAIPATPTLSQVVLGTLGARTLFARIGLSKNGLIYRVGGEASLAVSANNVLKITSPASVAGYDGWFALVGSATNAERLQSVTIPFGTDWTEPATGFDTTTEIYNNASWPNGVIAVGLNASTTYYFYPWWDLAAATVLFATGTFTAKSETAANEQNKDERIGLSPGGMTALTPGAGLSGSGANGGGKYL